MLSVCREDENYDKEILSPEDQTDDLIIKLKSFTKAEENSINNIDDLKLSMETILSAKEKNIIDMELKENSGDKFGFYYEKIASKIIINYLNHNQENLENLEVFMNIKQNFNQNDPKSLFREEDILCRVKNNILIFSMKLCYSRNSYEKKIKEESKRVSGLFRGVVPKEKIHRYIISPQSERNDKQYYDVKNIRLNELKSVIDQYCHM